MTPFARATGRRFAAFGAAAAFAVPALLGAAAQPSAAATAEPTPSATPSATPLPPAASSIGGPRMSERGLIFGGGAKPPPATGAASYVVADAMTGQILAAKDPHGHYRPASTLKTLLALTMAPRVDANGTYTADEADTLVEGTRVGMVNRQTYPLELLWYGLFLRSGNDAANAIAKAGADGDVAKAVRMMNLEAQRLQALDTTAVNPSGLDEDGQYSSAYDLSLWGRAALQRGDLRKYMTKLKIVFPGDHTKTSTKKNSKSFDVFTGNRLILRGYDGAIGVKNGYTTLARNTFIAAAERDGRTYIATLMRSSGAITEDSEALLDWAFDNAATVVPVGNLVDPVSLSVLTPEDAGYASPAPTGVDAVTAELSPAEVAATPTDAAAKTSPLGLPTPVIGGLAAAVVVAGGVSSVGLRKRRRAAPAGPPEKS